MEDTEKKGRRLALNLVIWTAPTLVLLLVNVFLFGLVLDRFNVFAFFLIPVFGLILTRLLFLLCSDRTVSAKAGLLAVWAILLAVLWFFSLRLCPRINHRVSHSNAVSKFETAASEIFPETFSGTLELGSPVTTELHVFTTEAILFRSKSYTLLCAYPEDEYIAEKAALTDRWSFRTEPLETFDIQGPWTVDPSVTIGDDVFHVLIPSDGANEFSDSFLRHCLLVVTNDVRHVIGYLVFEDKDLSTAIDLQDFLTEYCGWDLIR